MASRVRGPVGIRVEGVKPRESAAGINEHGLTREDDDHLGAHIPGILEPFHEEPDYALEVLR